MERSIIFFAIGVLFLSIIIVWYLLSWKKPETADHPNTVSRRELGVWVAILFGSILLYRGVTMVMDDYFFPDHSLFSAIGCVIMGIIVIGAAIYAAPEDVLAPAAH